MEPEQVEKARQTVNQIIKNMTKGDIQNLIMYFFETNETPEVIALNRGNMSIKGFIKVSKKIFAFNIVFLTIEGKNQMRIILQFGRQALLKDIEIIIKQSETETDIFLAQNKQYLFSVYF